MGKTRDLFKKIGDINGFHARTDMTKKKKKNQNINSKDLTKAEEIRKRWLKCTESERESEVAQ